MLHARSAAVVATAWAATARVATALVAAALVALPLGAQATPPPAAHFHHVHLNVTDPAKTVAFYEKYLGASQTLYRGKAPALFTERSFILLTRVAEPPRTGPKTAISHIGWAGVTGHDEYEWLKSQGVEFQTPIGQLGANFGMYFYGPDRELIEIWTGGKNHRFDHVHLWASDVEKSAAWFRDHLGLEPRTLPKPASKDPVDISSLWMSFFRVDNVNLILFGRPEFESRWWPGANYAAADGPQGPFEPTKGHVVDHLAFSYRDIQPVYERMKAAGAELLGQPETDVEQGFKRFLVMAPDHLLIEIVQERSIPEEIWD
jgi:catechol 2,3-dioxygenase-like lactoylglutathione lyase family enzyme